MSRLTLEVRPVLVVLTVAAVLLALPPSQRPSPTS